MAVSFFREHALLMRPGTSADHHLRVQEAFEAVRDKWIAEQRYEDLVRAITANWDTGDCVDYMAPLSQALVAAGELDLHRHLWTRTIKRQVDRFFHYLGHVSGQKPRFLQLLNADTSTFAADKPASYLRPERAAAFKLQRLFAHIGRWKDELRSANLPTDEPERIERCLQLLKVPQIRVNKLPPRAPSKPRRAPTAPPTGVA